MEGCHSETQGALLDEVHSGKGPHLESLAKVVVNNYLPNLEHEGIQIPNELLVGLGRNCNRLVISEEQRSPTSCTFIGQDGFTGFLQETSDAGIQMGSIHQKANGAMGKRLTYGAAVGKHALRQQARRRRRNTCIATGNSPPITRVTMKSSAPSAACSPSGLSPTNQQYSVNPNHCSPQSVKLEPSQISDSISDAGIATSFQVIEGVHSRTKNAIHLLGSDSMARIIVSKLNPATCGKISIDSSYNSYSDIGDYYDNSSPTTSRISPVSSFLTSPVVRTSSRLTGNSCNYSGATISGISSLQSQHLNSSNLNSQPQGSRSLRICLPQQSPSNKDSLSPSMTTMQTFLASIPGFKPRKRSQRKLSTAAQLALTKEGSVDLETPDSILVNVNLKSLVNAETYLSLPPVYQQRLAQLLPRVDQVIAHDNIVRIAPTGFHNEFLARACLSWRERLREGEFTHDNQVKLKGEAEKERSKLDPWKVAHFEPVWGMKHGNFGEELERDSNSYFEYFGEENDTSFSSSSSLNQSPLSPTYSEEYFSQLKKVIEFVASRDKRRKDRKEARKVELMTKLNKQASGYVDVASSDVRDIFSTTPDSSLKSAVVPQDDSSYLEMQQFHPSYDKNCDGLSISLPQENAPCQVGISEIELNSNLIMKRKESPVNIESTAKKMCSEESIYEDSANLPLSDSSLNNVELGESLNFDNRVNNKTITEVINQEVKEKANNASEQTISSMNKSISDGDDCFNKNYIDHEDIIFDNNDEGNNFNLGEQNCINPMNLPFNETKCEQIEEKEKSDFYKDTKVEINENIENENKLCVNPGGDFKNGVQICDNVIKVSKISKKGIFGQYGNTENKSHVRVIPYNILTVNEALLHGSEGTFSCKAKPVPSSHSSPKSPVNKKVLLDNSVVVTSSGLSNLPIQIQSHSISPKVEDSSPSRQNTVVSNKIRVSPVNIVLSQSPSHCANVMSITTANPTASPSVPSSSKRKAPQGSLYGCPVTLKISKSRGGVNLQRSYEIVQGVIANSPNRDQLKAQLKHHTVLMAESKNSVDNVLISPVKSNLLSSHISSDKEPMQISMQPRTSQFLVPQDNTSPAYSLVKSLSNERVNVSLSPTATSVGQILPTGQRLFRSVALPFTAINTVGNTLRIRPVTPHANMQTESTSLSSNLQFIHQNTEGCKSVINNSVPIRILRPASGGKPVYLRTLSVSNIHLVRVSDILNNSQTEGDQQPPRASSAPPSRNSIIASVIPRPNSVGPRILIPTSNSASALITSSTSSPTHHFLSEGDPSSGVISINSDKILSKGISREGIDAVDEQTRAGATHIHAKVLNSQAQHSFNTNDNVQFYDLKLVDDNLHNIKANDLQSNTSMQQCNMDSCNQISQDSTVNNSHYTIAQDENLFDHANHSDSGESIKSEQLLNSEPKMSEPIGQRENYERYGYEAQLSHDITETGSNNDFNSHSLKCNDNDDYDSNLKTERVDEQIDEGSKVESKVVVQGNFTPLERQEMQHHTSQQEFYPEFQNRSLISDLQRNCSNKSEINVQERLQLSHPATYQIVSPASSSQNYQQNLLQKQAFFIQQRQQCIRAPIHNQEPFQLQTQNAYQSVNLNPNVHVQQTNNQPMALNIQTFTNVNNNQISGNALSIVSIDNDGAPSSNGSEDGCPCKMRAMVACMKCGAFCHHDCVSPSRLCVTCLIR